MNNDELKDYIDQQILLHEHNGIQAKRVNAFNIYGGPSTYAGYVNLDGTTGTPFPKGWSATRTGLGLYTVTHNLNTTSYVAVLSCFPPPLGTTSYIVNLLARTSVKFDVQLRDYGNVSLDADFTFVVVRT